MAETFIDYTASGTRNGYSFTFTISHTEVYGSTSAYLTARPAYVKVKVVNDLYYDLEDRAGYSEIITVETYNSATAQVNNHMKINNVTVRAEITETFGGVYIAGTLLHEDIPRAAYEYWGL